MSADTLGMEKSGARVVQLDYQGIIPSGFCYILSLDKGESKSTVNLPVVALQLMHCKT
jgi:hypothetical protein